jgi:hypothetical protein
MERRDEARRLYRWAGCAKSVYPNSMGKCTIPNHVSILLAACARFPGTYKHGVGRRPITYVFLTAEFAQAR